MSTVYVRSRVVLVAALDEDEKDLQLKREDETLTTINHEFEAEESGHHVLAASETGFNVPMGKVATGELLYIETSQEITVKLDGGAEEIPIKPTGAGTKGKLLLMTSFTTAPQLDNDVVATAAEANITVLIAGAKA